MSTHASGSLLRSLLFVSSLLALPAPAQVLYVNGGAAGGGDGSSWAKAYNTIEAATTAARTNAGIQEIWVVIGTYKPAAVLSIRAGLGIYGGFRGFEPQRILRLRDPALTILDGQGKQRVAQLDDTATATTVLASLTITGGRSDRGAGLYTYGGSPTLEDIVFAGNQTLPLSATGGAAGAGFYSYQGSPTLRRVRFAANACDGNGGGLYCYSGSPTLEDCVFSDNKAIVTQLNRTGSGGGMYCYEGSPALTRCLFRRNETNGNGGGYFGYKGSPSFGLCLLEYNAAAEAGGSYDYEGKPSFDRCVLRGNVARRAGSACLYTYSGSIRLVGSIVAGSTGSAIWLYSGSATVVNSDLVASSTVGLVIASSTGTATLANAIVWGNVGGAFSGAPAATYSCIQGGWVGTGNIAQDPLLLNAGSGNARLQPGSPCVNAGDNTAILGATLDFEGDARVFAGTVDIGADEWLPGKVRHHADRATLSVSQGGTIRYAVQGAPARSGLVFVLVPSASGVFPATRIAGFDVPIVFDLSSVVLLSVVPAAFVGTLSPTGTGSSALPLPPLATSLQGFVLSTAALVLDPALGGAIVAAGNDDSVVFVQ